MKNKNLFISKDLYDSLTTTFPDKCPDIGTSQDKLWFDAGCAHVVSVLQEHVQEGSLQAVLQESLTTIATTTPDQQEEVEEVPPQASCFSLDDSY